MVLCTVIAVNAVACKRLPLGTDLASYGMEHHQIGRGRIMGKRSFKGCVFVAGLSAAMLTGSAHGISFSIDGLSPEFTVGIPGVAGAGSSRSHRVP